MENTGSQNTAAKQKRFFLERWQIATEILILLLAALLVGRKFLNFDPNYYIEGGEFVLTTISHYVWGLLFKCGLCVFWNGYLNGGAPSFIELHGAFLHPLVIVSTLLLGVNNGAKVIVLTSLFMVGMGQWWLAREMKLGYLARIWTSLMAIVAGSIFGRLQAGNVPMVLSIASASLVLPAFLHLKKQPNKRTLALMALILTLTWLSGQGYVQLVVILAYLPAVLWYMFKPAKPHFDLWKWAAAALLLSILLVSVLLVPFLHFNGNWQKPFTANLESIQPLGYSILNLVIHDWKFYDNTSLIKTISPWAHINFVGWIPVLLALLGLVFLKESRRKREVIFLFLATILALVFSNREIYLPLKGLTFVQQLRSLNVAASLAVQPLLLLAAITLQELIDRKWFDVTFSISTDNFSLNVKFVKWLVLIGLMVFSIWAPFEYGNGYLNVRHVSAQQEDLDMLKTDSAQWVKALNYDWVPFLLGQGDKLVIADRAWSWKENETVFPFLQVVNEQNVQDTDVVVKTQNSLVLLKNDSQLYASVDGGDMKELCSAEAQGGQIEVICTVTHPGVLTVREYYWTGWHAWMDGEPLQLDTTKDFLSVPASLGTHVYLFRYQPWDVYVGMCLSLVGIILLLVLLWKKAPAIN